MILGPCPILFEPIKSNTKPDEISLDDSLSEQFVNKVSNNISMQMDSSLSSIKIAQQTKIPNRYSICSIVTNDSFSKNDEEEGYMKK